MAQLPHLELAAAYAGFSSYYRGEIRIRMLERILTAIDQLRVNRRNGSYAVYKPLLLAMLFTKIKDGHQNEFHFVDLQDELERLMEKYGWNTKAGKKPQYPFYFLASSPLWNVDLSRTHIKHPDAPTRKELEPTTGNFDEDFFEYLTRNPESITTILKYIEAKYFDGKKLSSEISG